MKKMSFQYKLTRKNHYKSLLKNQLKTISIFLLIFSFCYFAINLEAFLYNFPYNTPLVIKTYIIFLLIIFIIMFIISLIFSLIMTIIFKKNNAYKIYNYELDKENLTEKNSNFNLKLNDIRTVKIKKNHLKLISFKLKQVIVFEKINFINTEDFENLKQQFMKK